MEKTVNKDNLFFVTGIDTGIGKTVATGLMARSFLKNGINVITQKMVQTGCVKISEDIVKHREIMGIDLHYVDKDGTTCPYLFKVPCSPHLAAQLEDTRIDCRLINQATLKLQEQFDVVFLEGAGGLSVPLGDDFTILDFVEEHQYPLIIVTSSRLGSINHTLNALEIARSRKLVVAAVVYNVVGDTDVRIVRDSRDVIERYLKANNFNCPIIDMGSLEKYYENNTFPDFFNELMMQDSSPP
ncbi:MAG: dethiobiotin synthetase [Desulforhopalus sp.]|jgi:dethiobiotin synthetase